MLGKVGVGGDNEIRTEDRWGLLRFLFLANGAVEESTMVDEEPWGLLRRQCVMGSV